jgi:AP-1 complex subunit gamma-1
MALSEICTAEMCRDLSTEVLKLLSQGTSYIKKKAALASTRIVKRVPEKLDDFVEKVEVLMEDRHHGVLIATMQLCQHIIQINPEKKQKFVRFVAPMTRILKSLVSTYSAEYDVSGISDPFLQIEILRFFRVMCEKSPQLSEEVSDILT